MLSWFINRSIASKIALCFGGVIAIGLGVGAVTYNDLSRIETSQIWATHTYQVLAASRVVEIGVLKQESDIRGYVLTRDADLLAKARIEDAALDTRLGVIQKLTIDNLSQQHRLTALAKVVGLWRAQLFAGTSELKSDARPSGAEGALNRILEGLKQVEAEEERLLALRSQASADALTSAYRSNSFGPLLALAVAGLLGCALHSTIALPIGRLTAMMRRLASGDTTIFIGTTRWKEEIGAMGRALEVFRQNVIDANRLRAEQQDTRLRAQQERQSLTASMADRFEAVVGSVVEAVSTSAAQMQTSAESLLGLAEWTTGEVKTVAGATKSASATMQSVAGETQHLSDSVGEINLRMDRSAEMAHQAVAEADRTTATIEGLSESANRIGVIVDLINDVARQTNLLALNATIEAARAGDAGRGFAIVATEVKALASQTAQATDDIRRQIENMQDVAAGAVAAITQISGRIGDMASVTTEIAAAVGIQGEATRDMMRGTQATARLTAHVSAQLAQVSEGAVTTGTAATKLLSSAKDLAQHSIVLHDEACRFVASVRAG